jgi:ADP-ribose pyrophosphatase YjhB (NUDIX family)
MASKNTVQNNHKNNYKIKKGGNELTLDRDDVLFTSKCKCYICRLTTKFQLRGITALICNISGKTAYGAIELDQNIEQMRPSGGHRDKGETLAECLIRELEEEIGLDEVSLVVNENEEPVFRISSRTLVVLVCVPNISKYRNIVKARRGNEDLPSYMREVLDFTVGNGTTLSKAFYNLIKDKRTSKFFKICVNSMFSNQYLGNENNLVYKIKNNKLILKNNKLMKCDI